MFNLLSLIFNPICCDAPEPWQVGFQDGATPTYEGITELHNSIFFYLVVVFVGVSWVIVSVIMNFSHDKNPIVYKYMNHGTVIELVWTITPAFVLIAIAFPSFKLLYLMDKPLVINDLLLMGTVFIRVKNLKSDSKALVRSESNRIGLTLNIRLTNKLRRMTYFPKRVISQIVGHLLGDGSFTMTHTSITPLFVFTQTIKRFDYVWHVFSIIGHYCGKLPRLNINTRQGKKHRFLQIYTRSYPEFLGLYKVFYVELNGKITKTITLDLLNYLNPISLAYWAMDDGAATTSRSGFYLHTKGFTFEEVYLLAGMLHYQFGLVVTVQNHTNQPVIYITRKSTKNFINLVKPYFHTSLMYKLEGY